MFPHKLRLNVVMDIEITLRMENWCVGDWDETQNGAHVVRRKRLRNVKPGNHLAYFLAFMVKAGVVNTEAP